MTRRSALSRLLAIVALASLLTGTADRALGRHPCPHHDGAVGQAAGGLAHSQHGAEPADDSGQSHACTCVGTCAQADAPACAASTSVRAPAQPARTIALLPESQLRAESGARCTNHLANPPPAL